MLGNAPWIKSPDPTACVITINTFPLVHSLARYFSNPQEEITLKAQAEGDLSEEQERTMIDKAKNLTKEVRRQKAAAVIR